MDHYKIQFSQVSAAGVITSNCAQITFVNQGTAGAYINDILLETGASLAISGEKNEMDTTDYNIRFAATGTAQLIVIRKRFVNVNYLNQG